MELYSNYCTYFIFSVYGYYSPIVGEIWGMGLRYEQKYDTCDY